MLLVAIIDRLNENIKLDVPIPYERYFLSEERKTIIQNERVHYLREISTVIRTYHANGRKQSEIARKLYQLNGAKELLNGENEMVSIDRKIEEYDTQLEIDNNQLLHSRK